MIFLTCAVCWSFIPPGPVEAEVKARIEALPVGQSTFKDLAWPETVVDALVDRVIGQSWRTSTQHPPRQPVGLTSERIAESVDPWLPEERASRIGWGNALRPAQANFFGKGPAQPGTQEQAAVLRELSTEGLVATLLTQAQKSAKVDRMLNVGIPLDLAGLFTGPDGIPVLERILSSTPNPDFPRSQFQLEWPTTNLQFCHDDGSDPSSGWRAHLPDLRLIDGRNDGSAADLLPRFSGTIAIAENQTISGTTGVRTVGRPDQWARDNGRLATDGQTKYLLRPRWASRGDTGTEWWPPGEFAAESYVRAGHAVSRATGLLWQGGNILLFRERDGRSHLLVSTTTLARNQRLGLTTEESARALQRTFGADAVTPLTPSGFHLDIELCVVQSPEGPVMFVADPTAAAKLLLENAFQAPANTLEEITEYRRVIDRNPPNPMSSRLQHACDLLLAELLLANESEQMTPEVRSAFAAMVRMAKRREAMVATLRSKGHEVRRVPSLVSIGRLWGPANALVTRSHVFWPQFGAGSEPAEETAARVYEGLGREVKGRPARTILERDGGLHCALEPIPASQPLND
ncbi:MAG: hypothetical protein AAFU75_08285 [Planctomycetota bacterium]